MDSYLDTWKVVEEHSLPFNFFIAGRGCGKTYSTLKGVKKRIGPHDLFIYLRRTQIELDNCVTEYSNPFKVLNTDFGWNVQLQKKRNMSVFMEESTNTLLGYAFALSTFKNARGMDFSDVAYIIFDEFIPESHAMPIRGEADAFYNIYETVNRNREFIGRKPVQCIFLGNSNTLESELVVSLRLAETIHMMKVRDESLFIDEYRGLLLWLGADRGFIDAKAKTALYKLTSGTNYNDFALNNEFVGDYFGNVNVRDMKQYKPLCSFENVYYWEHKSTGDILATFRKGNCPHYDKQTAGNFKRDFGFFLRNMMDRARISYSNYDCKIASRKILIYNTFGSTNT